jgi:hypothetical protein
VREFADDAKGDLAFWSKALENDLVEKRGYTLVEARDVEDAAGRKGREMLLEATAYGRPHRYLVTLVVIEKLLGNAVRTSEFAAEKEPFARYLEAVRRAIASVRP